MCALHSGCACSHDPRSPLSRKALQLLRNNAGHVRLPSQASGGLLATSLELASGSGAGAASPFLQSAKDRDEAATKALSDEEDDRSGVNSSKEYATEWLKRAARSDSYGGAGQYGEFELQIQDRHAQPPTDSQMKSILRYLKSTPVPAVTPPPEFDLADTNFLDTSAETGVNGARVAGAGAGSSTGVRPNTAAALRKIRQLQMKAQVAKDAAERKRHVRLLDADLTVDSLPRPPIEPAMTPETEGDDPSVIQQQQQHPQHQKQPASHLDHLSSASNPASTPSIRDGPLCVWWDEGMAATSVAGVQAMLERMKEVNAQHASSRNGGAGCLVM
ncbi:hypothetical protein K437DRAFT_253001 [Tilletiaria anomala UBC 951]|uniref:Uncharacterized protein n=1 Tax=Tilletiaria anomala (strain ATCC 24038 / CBS 436.72 / UBC 951) TaxID=1037660 RepID=A0A066WRK6_TILAU|nr:uncharacterized protein K437DRAFT_253001 [Tilletiaria anomala UBC 951]KDN53634.1 hypothetical protein K437DRAFT_253001 [Tilletiaria anomala UBC 951]